MHGHGWSFARSTLPRCPPPLPAGLTLVPADQQVLLGLAPLAALHHHRGMRRPLVAVAYEQEGRALPCRHPIPPSRKRSNEATRCCSRELQPRLSRQSSLLPAHPSRRTPPHTHTHATTTTTSTSTPQPPTRGQVGAVWAPAHAHEEGGGDQPVVGAHHAGLHAPVVAPPDHHALVLRLPGREASGAAGARGRMEVHRGQPGAATLRAVQTHSLCTDMPASLEHPQTGRSIPHTLQR